MWIAVNFSTFFYFFILSLAFFSELNQDKLFTSLHATWSLTL